MPKLLTLERDFRHETKVGMFGANMLFDRDRIGEFGTYDDVVRDIGFTNIRYPGGSVSEWYFDIDDPTRVRTHDRDSNGHRFLTPLDEFLVWAADADLGVNIVIPTSGLVEGPLGGKSVRSDAYERVRQFVEDVLRGKYGDARITAFEIGNEYWLEGGLDHTEYTEIADLMARAIQDAIDEVAAGRSLGWEEPDISLQVGQKGRTAPEEGWVQNEYIMDNLSKDALDAIDAVVMHYYARDAFEDLPAHDYYFDRLDTWVDRGGYADIDFHMTEWSVEFPGTKELGLMQASTMVWMMSQMILRGVDSAFVWPVQQNTPNDLSGNEGQTELTATGKVIRLMAEVLPESIFLSRSEFDGGVVYTFEGEGEIIVFVTSRYDHTMRVDVDPTDLGLLGGSYVVDVLGSSGRYDDPNAAATIDTFDGVVAGEVSVQLDAYEVARIVFSDYLMVTDGDDYIDMSILGHYEVDAMGGNDEVRGSEKEERILGGIGNDFLDGQFGNDSLIGHKGHDLIHAGPGSDILSGGPGRDFILGASGNDRIVGGSGSDRILGGSGNDLIGGGSGDDRIGGGSGNDRIVGGSGRDVLAGQSGGDRLFGGSEDDRLFGGSGNDLISGGPGSDIVSGGPGRDFILGASGNDRIVGGSGSDRIVGGSGNDLIGGGSGDDRIGGGSGNDRIVGGSGRDVLAGQSGGDRLFGGSEDDRLFGGSGNDLISGGRGSDHLEGGSGDDVLVGGLGPDIFVFRESDGHDVIRDFGEDDFIDLSGAEIRPNDLRIDRHSNATVIHYGDASIVIMGSDPYIDHNDFVF